MVVIHIKNPPRLCIEIRLGLVNTQVKNHVSQAVDVQCGQLDEIIS